jgi:hypothetical protein
MIINLGEDPFFEVYLIPSTTWILDQGLDSPPSKTRTVQPGDAFEDTVFKPDFDIVKL